jgi:hypothetical protein
MRTITLADPALTSGPAAWMSARDKLTARAGEPRDRGAGTSAADGADGVDGADATAAEKATKPAGQQSNLDRELTERNRLAAEARQAEQAVIAPETAEQEHEAAVPASQESSLDRERAERKRRREALAELNGHEPDKAAEEPRQVEQRPQLRKERALDPDWIGARPLFRDDAPTRPMPRIEFEPSAQDSPKPPRIAAMRSVVLNPEPDPPTLVEPEELTVPEFLAADFAASVPQPKPDPDPPTLIANEDLAAPDFAASMPQPKPDPDPPTLIANEDLAVPDFVVPGFSEPPPQPPLRTVLSTVLGPELWQRCYAEWEPGHCAALARVARGVDGLAPSAGATVRSTAGAGMRWLGVVRERALFADLVAAAISHPAGASDANRARTVRLYGAAICVALNIPLRRCACHRDLERDVSGELIRLGLAELAGEVT